MTAPGPVLRIAYGRPPAFRVFALAGLAAGVVVTVSVARVPVHVVALAVGAGLCLCLGALALRVAATRQADLVWSEHEAAVVVATVVVGWTTRALPGLLDAIAVGLMTMLTLGRIGCLLAGCCHGRPVGRFPARIRYGSAHVAEGFPASLAGVPLVPVQALEAGYAALLASAGVVLVATARPGTACLILLAGRALGRLGWERLRGDTGRGAGQLSRPQWWALGSLSVAAAAAVFVVG